MINVKDIWKFAINFLFITQVKSANKEEKAKEDKRWKGKAQMT